MSTAQAQPRTWLEAVREPVAVVARPVEWWEWLLAARDGWREAHPRLMRGLAVATMVVVWLCIPVLVVVALLVPHAAAALRRAWPCWWLLVCWFVLARTKTVGWVLCARLFAFCIVWAMVIGFISWQLWPLAVDHVRDAGASVGIAAPTEESLKLVPLLALAVAAPGRVRRFAAVDWLLTGFACGLGFLLVEEMARQAAVSPWSLFGPVHVDFSLSPLSGNQQDTIDGVTVAAPGHHIHTALVAVCIGLAVAAWRHGRARPVPAALAWRAFAVLLPFAAWWVVVTDHAGWNAVAASFGDETVDSQLAWADGSRVPPVIAYTWTALGHGRGRPALLLALLLVAVLVDARRMHTADRGIPLIPDLRWTDPDTLIAYTRPATTPMLASDVPAALRWLLRPLVVLLESCLALGTYLVRDVVLVVLANARAPQDEEPWTFRPHPAGTTQRPIRRTGLTVLTGLTRGRLAVTMIRDARLCAQETSAGPTRSLIPVRLLALLGLALAAAAAGPLAVWWAGNIGDHLGLDGSWLAGFIEQLGKLWDALGPVGQLLVVFGVAALLILTGVGFGAALFLTGIAAYLLTHRRGVAALAHDPRGATRRYLATRSPQGIVLDVLEFGFTFIPGGVGATTGRALRLALRRYLDDPVTYRTALRAALKDETGAVAPDAWRFVRKKGESPNVPLSQAEIDRRHALGLDGATRRFRPSEAHCAVLVEDKLGIKLTRYPGQGPDWIDTKTGKTYDAVGSSIPREHFDKQWTNGQIQHRIEGHHNKADYVPVDVSGLNEHQQKLVIEFVNGLRRQYSNIFIVGA